MRKLLTLTLAIALVFSVTVPVFAASDVTWSSDTTLTKFINAYDNAVVKAGVTVTMKEMKPDPQGLEIKKSLTVEAGGTIRGGGCIIFERSASCTGFDLYYIAGGSEKILPVGIAELVKLFPTSDYRPTFNWNASTGHYVLASVFEGDPFDTPEAGGAGGSNNAENCANALKSLGLFLGSDNGFELDRKPTRVEAVIMLIRLLGKEAEAKSGTYSHPFTDVPAWADNYVGYAYENSLANGTGKTTFGTEDATAQMFATFVLRALGYQDDTKGGTDFTYAGAVDFAQSRGLVSGPDMINNFNRGSCVKMMESALRQALKTGDPLYKKLAGEGVFTEEAYKAAMSTLNQ